jgi:two-component system chemotaxis response regulator CheB
MGRDGASGLLEMRQAGASTLGQDEGSCVVYGMPRVAFEEGAVERQLPLSRLPAAILDLCADPAV